MSNLRVGIRDPEKQERTRETVNDEHPVCDLRAVNDNRPASRGNRAIANYYRRPQFKCGNRLNTA